MEDVDLNIRTNNVGNSVNLDSAVEEPFDLEAIFANMPGFIFFKNVHSEYIWCNNALARVSGLDHRQEIKGKTDHDFDWSRELTEQFTSDDQHVMRESITLTKEYRLPIKRKDGHYLYIRMDKMPFYDEKNNTVGILAIAVDITDQKILESETHINHTLIEDILYNLPGLIYWKNKQSQYVGFNKNVVELSGLSREELIGKTDLELNWGKKEAESFQKDDKEVMETGITKITEHQIPIKRPDGHYIIVRTEKSRLLDRNNNVAGILAVAVDITDERLLEEKLKQTIQKSNQETIFNLDSIIANMPGAVYWKDTNSRYMGCNDNLAKIAKLKTRDEIIGKTDYDFDWGKNGLAGKFISDDKQVMEEQINQFTTYRLPIKGESGKQLWVKTEKMPLYNQEKKVIGVLAIAMDITEQKMLEEQLIAEKERVEYLTQQKKAEFIRNMEHDIRTPFSGIYSIAKFLDEKETDKEKKRFLSAISQCAKELLDYCNGILDFSKIESGTMPVLMKKFNLQTLINTIVTMEKPAAMDKHLHIMNEYAEDTPEVFIGDPYRLQRILINLVSNAIKFTQKGYVKVSARLAKQISEKDCIIRLFVEDTGIGIPQEKQTYIYECFNRLTPSNQNRYKGSGLGLTIVKHLLEELNGEIDVSSHPDKGTIFVCTVPLKEPLLDDILFEESV